AHQGRSVSSSERGASVNFVPQAAASAWLSSLILSLSQYKGWRGVRRRPLDARVNDVVKQAAPPGVCHRGWVIVAWQRCCKTSRFIS
ncbi:unnamed protein product, partial [Ectocarpus sp. 12 AP-2014]